jgi:hypothetical protein
VARRACAPRAPQAARPFRQGAVPVGSCFPCRASPCNRGLCAKWAWSKLAATQGGGRAKCSSVVKSLASSRWQQTQRRLTPPSSGHATAGFARRVMPLMSNVSPLPGIPMRRVTTVRTTSRAASHCWLSRAARIAHGGAVPDRMAAETQLASSARAVRPLAAGALPALLGRGSGVSSTAVLSKRRSQMPPEGEYTNPNQMPWLTRRARTLALRRSAEPEPQGSAGTGFARAGGVGALGWQSQSLGAREVVPSFARANTSVERTTTGKPAVAAHLRR